MKKEFLGVEVPGMEKSDILKYIKVQIDSLNDEIFTKGAILQSLAMGDYDIKFITNTLNDVFCKESDCVRRLSVAIGLLEEVTANE